jgi:hypothetical protein
MSFSNSNKTTSLKVQPPDQLFHLHITDALLQNPLRNLLGACVNDTIAMKWEGKENVTIAPISTWSVSHNELDVTVELIITIHDVTPSQDFAIFEYIKDNKIGEVLELLEKHIGVNAVDERGNTPLMLR